MIHCIGQSYHTDVTHCSEVKEKGARVENSGAVDIRAKTTTLTVYLND